MRAELLNRSLLWGWGWAAVALVLGTGCLTQTVRLETTGQKSRTTTITPRNTVGAEFGMIDVDSGEWADVLPELAKDAKPFASNPMQEAWAMFRETTGSGEGNYRWDRWQNRLVGADAKTRDLHLIDPDDKLAKEYALWCERGTRQPGDCLGILEGSAILSRDAKNALALRLAMGSVLEGAEAELHSLTNARSLVITIGVMLAIYFTLLAFPDLSTKGLAAAITITGVSYLGYDVFFGIIRGWIDLMQATDNAQSFAELREAGETFGELMGEKAARILVMIAMAAMGGSASQLAANLPKLPGFPQAAIAGSTQLNVNIGAIEAVQAVAVNVEAVELSIVLAPNAVAMMSGGAQRTRPTRLSQRPQSSEERSSTNLGRDGASAGGPGRWEAARENMKPAARRYQTQITGVPEGQVYRVEGVRFDGFKDGVLLETKGPGYAKFLKKDGAPYEWFRGFKAMLEQAKRQLRVSGGTPIRWHFAEREAADYTRKLFNSNDIEDIEIVFTAVTH